MEKDICARLRAMFGDAFTQGDAIIAYDGRVKGHPDGWLYGRPLDVKSVAFDDWLPERRLPRKVYLQMQAYMLYGGDDIDGCFVVYESRQSGLIRVSEWMPDHPAWRYIDNKVAGILLCVEEYRRPPECECGKCTTKRQ